MKSKFKVLLIQLLMIVSLVSYGFASWEVSQSILSVEGEFTADNFNNSTKCIQLDSSIQNTDNGIKTLKYYETGFVDPNGVVSLIGTIEVNYILNINNIKDQFNVNDYNYITINIDLQCTSNVELNLFETNSNQKFTCTSTLSYKNQEIVVSNNECYSSYRYDYKTISNNQVKFKVIYNFEILNDTFYQTVFNMLEEESTKFNVTASIDGYKGGNS